jgi:glycosyltransferase involved in cell wall biosynthesis
MEGPMDKTGGVANHMRCLLEELHNQSDLHLIAYDSSIQTSGVGLKAIITKLYGRFIGFPSSMLKYRREYDIIHTQSSGYMPAFHTAIIASFFAKLLNKEHIFTFHHSATESFISRHRFIVGAVCRNSAACILVSERQREAFARVFGPSSLQKIHVIPNGFNPKNIYPMDKELSREKLVISSSKKVLLNVAYLEAYKGHVYLVEAMKKVCNNNENVQLFILGHGSLEKSIRNQILENGLGDYVFLISNYQTSEQIRWWLNAADFFVLSSLEEGNPTVMFECLGSGLPFIGTRVGGVPEIISSEKYGLLCEPGDSTDLAEKILHALECDWDHLAIVDYGSNFHWSHIAGETMQVYESIRN